MCSGHGPSSGLRLSALCHVHVRLSWEPTMVLECFHLVSLFNILSRLIQENRFLQQKWLLSPAS